MPESTDANKNAEAPAEDGRTPSQPAAGAGEPTARGKANGVSISGPPGGNSPTKPAASQDKPSKPPKDGESWVETVKTIVYALLIALVIRTFLFQPFNIPSGSMENTLLIGDYLFVEKFAYGYSRHSFPFSIAPFSGRIFGRDPQRGDVVVFKMPDPNSEHYMDDYIKRVIGLPGDTVQMIQGRLYINDKPVPKVKAADYVENECGIWRHVPRFRETLPNGKSYYVLDRLSNGPGDNTQVYKVPPGHYFMMGDNRDNSADSRLEVEGFGFVPAEDLVGKAEFIFFSIAETTIFPDSDTHYLNESDGCTSLWRFWRWPLDIRYNRLFTVID